MVGFNTYMDLQNHYIVTYIYIHIYIIIIPYLKCISFTRLMVSPCSGCFEGFRTDHDWSVRFLFNFECLIRMIWKGQGWASWSSMRPGARASDVFGLVVRLNACPACPSGGHCKKLVPEWERTDHSSHERYLCNFRRASTIWYDIIWIHMISLHHKS